MRAPLAFYPGSSWAYTEKLLNSDNPEAALTATVNKWLGNDYFAGDWQKPYQQLLMDRDAVLHRDFQETSLSVFKPLIDHLEGG